MHITDALINYRYLHDCNCIPSFRFVRIVYDQTERNATNKIDIYPIKPATTAAYISTASTVMKNILQAKDMKSTHFLVSFALLVTLLSDNSVANAYLTQQSNTHQQ